MFHSIKRGVILTSYTFCCTKKPEAKPRAFYCSEMCKKSKSPPFLYYEKLSLAIPFAFWSAFYFQLSLFWISKCKIWLWQSWNCGIRQSGFKESRSSSLPENLHFPSTFPENSQKSYLFLKKMGLFLRLFKPHDRKQDVKYLPIGLTYQWRY